MVYDRLSEKPLSKSKESDHEDTNRSLEQWLKRMGPVEIDASFAGNTMPILMNKDESIGESSSSDDDIVEEKSTPNLQR
jgi:hypothetical protein